VSHAVAAPSRLQRNSVPSTQMRCMITANRRASATIAFFRQQRFRLARHLRFPNDLARIIHNADARLLDRNVQSSKIVHAALLLLMLEAVTTDLVSPSA